MAAGTNTSVEWFKSRVWNPQLSRSSQRQGVETRNQCVEVSDPQSIRIWTVHTLLFVEAIGQCYRVPTESRSTGEVCTKWLCERCVVSAESREIDIERSSRRVILLLLNKGKLPTAEKNPIIIPGRHQSSWFVTTMKACIISVDIILPVPSEKQGVDWLRATQVCRPTSSSASNVVSSEEVYRRRKWQIFRCAGSQKRHHSLMWALIHFAHWR